MLIIENIRYVVDADDDRMLSMLNKYIDTCTMQGGKLPSAMHRCL